MPPSSDYIEALERVARRIAVIQLQVRNLRLALKAGFRPDQLRIPGGRPGGGRWTEEGGKVVPVQAGSRSSGGGRTRGGSTYPNATLRQQTELAASRAAADAGVSRVRERQPNWKPTPGLYETIEGAISHTMLLSSKPRRGS